MRVALELAAGDTANSGLFDHQVVRLACTNKIWFVWVVLYEIALLRPGHSKICSNVLYLILVWEKLLKGRPISEQEGAQQIISIGVVLGSYLLDL